MLGQRVGSHSFPRYHAAGEEDYDADFLSLLKVGYRVDVGMAIAKRTFSSSCSSPHIVTPPHRVAPYHIIIQTPFERGMNVIAAACQNISAQSFS